MTSKLYVQQMLSKLSLLQLRQLALEFNLLTHGSKSKSQSKSQLINLIQIGGADPVGQLEDYSIIGGQLEAFLLNYVDTLTGEVDIPMEQFKTVLKNAGINYVYSPKKWFKILLPSKIISKIEQPFNVLPMFVNTLNVLPQLSYGELKLLNYYYPKTLNISQGTLEAKRQSDLADFQKWVASYWKKYSIETLSNLRWLNLSETQLKSLPESIGVLSNLDRLNLNGNPLESLPNSIGALSKLEAIGLNKTHLKTLPDSIGALSNLKRLWLIETHLESLPESIGNLSNLERLILTGTPLKSLPDSIGKLSKLNKLILNGTPLLSLPDSIGKLSNLDELNLSETQLKTWPNSIGGLSNLIWLNLSGTHGEGGRVLRSLPDSIGKLSKLYELDLSRTPLKSLPDSIGKLSNLYSLNISKTPIKSLPDSIGKLSKLRLLDLSDTPLKSLPDSIGDSNLEKVYIDGTSLELLPVVKYLKQRGVISRHESIWDDKLFAPY